MSKLWRKDGTTVEITRITPAGGGESHHSIFGWADNTKETARTERTTSQEVFAPVGSAEHIPAAGVTRNPRQSTFKLADKNGPQVRRPHLSLCHFSHEGWVDRERTLPVLGGSFYPSSTSILTCHLPPGYILNPLL